MLDLRPLTFFMLGLSACYEWESSEELYFDQSLYSDSSQALDVGLALDQGNSRDLAPRLDSDSIFDQGPLLDHSSGDSVLLLDIEALFDRAPLLDMLPPDMAPQLDVVPLDMAPQLDVVPLDMAPQLDVMLLDMAPQPDADPDDPYAPLENLQGVALADAISTLIAQSHRSPILWDNSKFAIFTDLDLQEEPDGSFYAECIYTGQHFPLNGIDLPNFNDFNIEHSWPKSLGAGREPAKGDLHHLFPVNSRVNSFRSSHHFGDTDCEQHNSCNWSDGNGSALGSPAAHIGAGGTDKVFMVRRKFRGDIARAHFYFALRYPRENTQNSFPDWEETLLRRWHEDDPVDDWERRRNDGIEGYQGNRSPFVDHPEWVERIQNF